MSRRKLVAGDVSFVRLGETWHNINCIVKITNSVVLFSDGQRVPHGARSGAAFLEEVGGIEFLHG